MGKSMDKCDTKLPPLSQPANRDDLGRPSKSADPIPSEVTPLLQPRDATATRQVQSSVDDRTDKPSLFLAGLSTARFWIIFSQILATQFMCFFDTTIMASSHPAITSYFGAAHSASWLSTAFMVMSTITQPFLGRLSDAFGRKPLFLGTQAIFSIATLWCSLATSIKSLIAARAVCGIGAGGTLVMGSIMISDMVPVERRGTYLSYINVVVGIGSGLGATFGGAIAETIGWRWEFGVQVPPLLVCLGAASVVIPDNLGVLGERESISQVIRGFDALGAFLLTLAVSTLILGLNLGGNILPWSHPFVVASLMAFCSTFPIFLLIESRAEKPIMPLRFIFYRPRANLIISNFIGAIISNAILFNVPLYFQAVLLTSATSSGLRLMLPAIVSSATGALTGLLITMTRRLHWPLVCAAVLYLSTIICLVCMQRGFSVAVYLLALVPYSVANGLQYTTTAVAVLATSTRDEQAIIMSTLAIWRSLGTVLGVALSSVVVQNALLRYLHVFVYGPRKDEVIALVRASVQAIAKLDQPYREQVVQSYEAALRLAFGSCLITAVISALLVVPIQLPRLPSSAKR
ncbi:major facilitator superfamily domain-containing protein [Aspergillus bertholletiae]|uniref:Major facilitator superfamily domain-containing protein n=1 Tax=Aspergillus bertholletiae TaxID=1226010 RepID=A0A5N7BKS8_9EURO|nr:major facilitator superfamily domain-containing protein [Aspergillus bertholletiae]